MIRAAAVTAAAVTTFTALACAQEPKREPTQQEKLGNWTISRTVSKMDDSKGLFAYVDGTPYRDTFGDKTPSLVVRCAEGKTALYLDMKTYIAMEGTRPVTLRVGSGKARTAHWPVSTDFNAIGAWSGPESIPLIRELAKAKTAVLRVCPAILSDIDMSFDLEGLDRVAAELSQLCRWPVPKTSGSTASK